MTRFVHTLALFLVIFGAIDIAAAATPEPRIALVIGNSAYATAPLANSVNDARLMAETLRGLGFEVIERIDADRKTIQLATFELQDRLVEAGNDAVGLFYYAGHGVQVGGQNYLIPLNSEIVKEREVSIEAGSAGFVLKQMEFAGNRMNFVILDAYRNNPLTRSFRSATRGLARMDAPRGSLVAYSTGPGEVAADGTGANSPYTLALAQAMETPGLPAEQMFKLVRDRVMDVTDGKQTPWEESSLTGANFYFTVAEPDAVESVAPSSLDVAEQAFWQAIKDSANASDYLAYLNAYPDGVYAALARARADDLQTASASQATEDTSASDLAFWDSIKGSTNPADYAAYLQQIPDGSFAPLARVRQASAEESAREAAEESAREAAELEFWQSVESSGQAEGYQAYISAYPLGKYTEVARVRMLTLAQSERGADQAASQVAALDPGDQASPTQFGAEMLRRFDGDWILEIFPKGDRSKSDIVEMKVTDGRFLVAFRYKRERGTFTGEFELSGRLSARGNIKNNESDPISLDTELA